MTIITRLTRLFKADLHGILDRLEDPREVLKQAVRDMESELETKQNQFEAQEKRRTDLKRKQEQLAKTLTEISGQIEFCFKNSDEVLARASVKRELLIQKKLKLLVNQSEKLSSEKVKLEQTMKEQKEKLEEIKEKMELFLDAANDQEDPVLSGITVPGHDDPESITEEDIEIAFLQAKNKWSVAQPEK